jgi:hypothetical protein
MVRTLKEDNRVREVLSLIYHLKPSVRSALRSNNISPSTFYRHIRKNDLTHLNEDLSLLGYTQPEIWFIRESLKAGHVLTDKELLQKVSYLHSLSKKSEISAINTRFQHS